MENIGKKVEFKGHKFTWHESDLLLVCHNPNFVREDGRQVDATQWPESFELAELLGLEVAFKGYGKGYSKEVM